MKTLIQDYIFDHANKRVIFTGLSPESLEEVLLVTNVTTGDIIYNFADKLRGGSLSNNVLTLTFDTSKMSDTDSLQIFVESDNFHQVLMRTLASMYKAVNYSRDAGDRMRIIMDNNPMLYAYNRNTSTSLQSGATESWYSASSWSTIDGREQLMEINKDVFMTRTQRWQRT